MSLLTPRLGSLVSRGREERLDSGNYKVRFKMTKAAKMKVVRIALLESKTTKYNRVSWLLKLRENLSRAFNDLF